MPTPLSIWFGGVGRDGFDLRFSWKVAVLSVLMTLSAPARVAENWRFRRRIEACEVHPSPIFIIGHWRSGTTHLHNLLSLDPRFGYVTTLQAISPHAFLSKWALTPWMIRTFIPKRRPMDNMRFTGDLPQEDEIAMVSLTNYCLYRGFAFPKRMIDLVDETVFFEGAPKAALDEWKAAYRDLLRRATFNMGGKRLVSKSPPNTGRIRLLLW